MSTVEKGFSRVTPRLIRLRDAPFYLGMDRCYNDGKYDAIKMLREQRQRAGGCLE